MNKASKITAVLADIHGNLEALSAVLADIENRRYVDDIVCLGDIVGYGPDPAACLDLIREKAGLILAGNHDLALISADVLSQLNPDARTVILWTAERLDPEQRRYLFSLPLEFKTGPFHFVHGSPEQPSGFNYILNTATAKRAFLNSKGTYIFTGHSHIPRIFIEMEYKRMFAGCVHNVQSPAGPTVEMTPPKRYLINAGSVGQSRDGDARAAYGLIDMKEHRFERIRVAYDVDAVICKMRRHGLPEALAKRLKDGR